MTASAWSRARAAASTATSRNVRSLWTTSVFGLVLASVSSLVLARHLGPAGYGYLGIVSAFGALVFAVLDPRAGEALTRFLGPAVSRGNTTESSGLVRAALLIDGTTCAVGVGGAAFAHWALSGAVPGATLDVLLATSGFALFSPMNTCRAALGVLDEFRAPARVGLVFAVLRTAAVLGLVVLGTGVRPVLIAALVLGGVELLVLLLLVVRRFGRAWPGGLGAGGTGSIGYGTRAGALRFLRDNGLSTLLGSLVKHADTVILGAVAGANAVAFYRLAVALTAPVGALSAPLQTVVYNRLVQVRAREDATAEDRVLRRSAILALGLSLALLATVPLMPFVVSTLAGDAYRGAIPAGQILLVGACVGFAGLWLRPLFLASGKERLFLYVSLSTAALALISFVVGASNGAVGMALARVASVSVFGTAVLYGLSRRLRKCRNADSRL